jgi:ABC-2 type transport system ATP-binding protein
MDSVIQIERVWKSYGPVAAVSGLDLRVPPRSVYGFLGPNGAGKSTTIRLVLGLQRPDRGRVFLFGRPLLLERISLLRRLGSLVESPSLYLHLTGREHLEIHRRLLGIPQRAIDEVLDVVDLTAVGNRLVRNYSSGMKQRLGLATALLGNPELLVLDEPTNGLDPGGIHEVRNLVRDLPQRCGATVFLSSHLLAEVEQVATHLAIISQGHLKFEGTPDDLHRSGRQMIVLKVDRAESACELLTRNGRSAIRDKDRILVTTQSGNGPAELNRILVQAGFSVSHVSMQHLTLEELFLELTVAAPEKEFATQ